MPEHEQLGVLGCRWPTEQDQPGADPDEDENEIEQAYGQGTLMMARRRVSGLDIATAHRPGRLLTPHTLELPLRQRVRPDGRYILNAGFTAAEKTSVH
jgi:hypothetical protein